jgi:hypothetical protein
MKLKFYCFFLVMNLILLGMISAQDKANSGLAIECCFPAQVAAGLDSRVVIISNAIKEISAVKINPPDDISIKKIEEINVSDYDKKQGKKRWEIILTAGKKIKIGTRSLVLETPGGLSQEKQINVIPYIPEITNLKIISAKKDKWEVNFMLSVKYPGKALSDKSQLSIQMVCGVDAIFSIRDVKKAVNKGGGKWEITGMVDNPGMNAYCEDASEINISLSDDNDYQSKYFTHKFQFK